MQVRTGWGSNAFLLLYLEVEIGRQFAKSLICRRYSVKGECNMNLLEIYIFFLSCNWCASLPILYSRRVPPHYSIIMGWRGKKARHAWRNCPIVQRTIAQCAVPTVLYEVIAKYLCMLWLFFFFSFSSRLCQRIANLTLPTYITPLTLAHMSI